MAKTYSPKTFLRQTPNRILKDYFHGKDLLKNINFDELGETQINSIMEAWQELPDKQRYQIEAEFRTINELADAHGRQLLYEESVSIFHNLDITAKHNEMENHYEWAFWMYVNHDTVFNIAIDHAFMDTLTAWKRYGVDKGLQPKVDQKDLDNLVDEIIAFYKKQGRGRYCHVDNYLRQQPERHCYFIYPEDYASTEIGYNDANEFVHRRTRPAFEIVFVYLPETGVFETSARGGAETVTKLQDIFCRTILGLDGLPSDNKKKYDLSRFKDRDISFPTEPEDGIEYVSIKMLHLELPGTDNNKITFQAKPKSNGQRVYELIEKALNEKNVPFDSVNIAKVKLKMQFAGVDGKKGKPLTFDITMPDGCTLKEKPHHLIAKKYISRWGLEIE